MATSMNPDAPHYEGGLSFVIKSHGRLPALSHDLSDKPIGGEKGIIDLSRVEHAYGIHAKIFTYTDPGGAVCPVAETVRGICSGSREGMQIYESPVQYAYQSFEQRKQTLEHETVPSPIRVYAPNMQSQLPDYILSAFTEEEASKSDGLPGGVYLCQQDKLIYPLGTPGTQVTLSSVIKQVILRYAQAFGATSVDIHLITCLSTGGIGVGAGPQGTDEARNSLLQAHQRQQALLRRLGENLPPSDWTSQLPSPAAPERKPTRVLPHWMYSAPGGGKRKGKRRKRTRKGRRPRRSTRRRR